MVVNAAVLLSNTNVDANTINALMALQIAESIFAWMFIVSFLIILGVLINYLFSVRNSKEYRRKIADMYVVGVIKNFAAKDDVSIDNELIKFEKDVLTSKKERRRHLQELDEVIEDSLKEKVDLHQQEMVDNLNSSKVLKGTLKEKPIKFSLRVPKKK